MEEKMEELKAKHRKEMKEMQTKIMQLKKSVGGNKKRKKEVQQEIAQLETEIKARHQKEIDDLNKENSNASESTNENKTENDSIKIALENNNLPIHQTQKKPNRQKLRKERKAQKMLELRNEAEEEAKHMVNTKQIEEKALQVKLDEMGLRIEEIKADGHCLYNSIAHQLSLYGKTYDYKQLRHITAEWMRNHIDDFQPFLLNQDGELYNNDEYQKYCDDVENTSLWGGQLEIQAMSQALQYPITVIQSDSAPIEIGSDFTNEKLYISYHHHSYSLGEHYNSLVKA